MHVEHARSDMRGFHSRVNQECVRVKSLIEKQESFV